MSTIQKTYKIKIGEVERDLPICPITEDLYIAAFVILGDYKLTEECAKKLLAIAPEYDYILSAEAKGIPLAHEMARMNNDEKYIIARKGAKLYMTGTFEVSVRSITTAREQKLYIDTQDAELMKGKRVLLVDDVISTGESINALEILANKAGANIVGRLTILAEGDAQYRKDIKYLEVLPLFDKDGNPIKE